jgi:hypothetical protein
MYPSSADGKRSGRGSSLQRRSDDFALIDAGAYTIQYLSLDFCRTCDVGNEIPENGVQIFVKAGRRNASYGDTAANLELIEYYRHIIFYSTFESLLVRNDYQAVTCLPNCTVKRGLPRCWRFKEHAWQPYSGNLMSAFG